MPPRGTTLLEVLFVLTIAAVLFGLVIPSFARLVASSRLTANVNGFVATVQLARSEAIKQRLPVVVCRSHDGTQCVYGSAGWQDGWLVFADATPSDPPLVQSGDTIVRIESGFAGVVIAANRRAFVFRPLSRRATNGTVVFCSDSHFAGGRAVIINTLGRPRVAATLPNGDALACPP